MAKESKIYSALKLFIPLRARKFIRNILNTTRLMPYSLPAVVRARAVSFCKDCNPRLVVFISGKPNERQAKLSYGLRSAGWNVVLLYAIKPNYDATRYFDEVACYENAWQALSIASGYAPRAYHVFSPMVDETSLAFVRHKPGKVVYDVKDVVEGINDPLLFDLVPQQRYCIEAADGLCCRDLQIQYVTRNFGYKRPAKVIFFPEYCWNFPEGPGSMDRQDSDEIHVVLIGNFGVEKFGDTDVGYLEIAERLAAQEIHFHIYPSWGWTGVPFSLYEETFSDYIALSQRTPFVHFHQSVPMDEVIGMLRRHTAGISVVAAQIYGRKLSRYSPALLRSCGAARNMDYIDAGLPVIINKGVAFQYFMLDRHGLAIEATPETIANVRPYLKRFLSPDLIKRLRKARSIYSVQRQIHRLTSFYESL